MQDVAAYGHYPAGKVACLSRRMFFTDRIMILSNGNGAGVRVDIAPVIW